MDDKKFIPKYYKRIDIGKKKYRYFYTKEEWLAYSNKEDSEKQNGVVKNINTTLTNSKSYNTSGSLAGIPSAIENMITNGQKFTNQQLTKKVSKTAVSGSNDNFVEDMVDVGKKVVSTLLGGLVGLVKNEIADAYTEYKEEREKEVRKDQTTPKTEKKSNDDMPWKAEEERRRAEEDARRAEKENEDPGAKAKRIEQLTQDAYNDYMEYVVNDEIPKSFDDLKVETDEDMTLNDHQEAINPYYETGYYEYTQNCAYCTAAWELRQRGYDVEAAPVPLNNPNDLYEILSWYENSWQQLEIEMYTSSKVQETADKIEKQMISEGEGARGQFLLYWNDGGGHAVAWSVENGNAVLRDCQNNDTIELTDYMDYAYQVAYFRTDNVELTDRILKTVKNDDD